VTQTRFLDELDHLQYAMRSRSASVVFAKQRRAIVSSPRSGSGRLLGNPGPIDPLLGIKPIADSISEPVQSPSSLNTPTR
jgi:hypothetical protein